MGEELQELCQQGQIGNADFEVILGALHEGGQRLILLLDSFDQLIQTQVTNETVTRDFDLTAFTINIGVVFEP